VTTRRAAGPLLVILLSSVALAVLDASGQAFWQGLVINLGLFIILTVSLNLTSGFTGVFSLGQIGFMALGAYASAILTLPLQEKAAYLPNLPSWIAGVHFDEVDEPSFIDFLAGSTDAARRGGDAGIAVEALREDARDGGLAHAARAGEQESVMHAPLRQCIAQRVAHVFLADELREGPRSPLAREGEIAHRLDNPRSRNCREAARTSRTSAPDIAATAAPFRA